MVKKTNVKKTAALIGAGALILGGVIGGVVGYNLVNTNAYYNQGYNEGYNSVDVKGIHDQAFQEGVSSVEPTVIHEVKYVNQTVEVPVEVEKIVKVDNGNLDAVLEQIFSDEGNVSYVLDDLTDDQKDLIVDRILFLNDARTVAFNGESNTFTADIDMVEFVNSDNETITFDDDEIYGVRIDFSDVVVDKSTIDFDNNYLEVVVPVSFKQEGVRYNASMRVTVEDSAVKEVVVDEVTEE